MTRQTPCARMCAPRITLLQYGQLQTALRKIPKKTHLSRAPHLLKKSTSTWTHVVHSVLLKGLV